MKLRSIWMMLVAASILSYPVLGDEVTKAAESKVESEKMELNEVVDSLTQVHDQEVAFMRKYGEEVNVSAVQGEVRMTVERMVADAYTARFLIAIE
ncbi:MAG: hypothetical protein ACRCW2_00175, partial [Cellulosilyticaceae bacterium]